jgi:hypothetical protein
MAKSGASVWLNPVFGIDNKDSSTKPKILLRLLSDFPEFEQEGSEFTVKLARPDSYITIKPSGIMYSDVEKGTGQIIHAKTHQVGLRYNLYTQCSRGLIESFHFEDTPTKLGKRFSKGLLDAIQGMKCKGYRRIIIPPKLSETGEFIVVDVILWKVDNGKSFISKM